MSFISFFLFFFLCMLRYHCDAWMRALDTATYCYEIWIAWNVSCGWSCTHFDLTHFYDSIWYLLDNFLFSVGHLLAIIRVHFNLLSTQETRLGLVYLQILPLLLCLFFYNLSSLYFSMLVYQIVTRFGLHIATWECCFRWCKRPLNLVSKGESRLLFMWVCCPIVCQR